MTTPTPRHQRMYKSSPRIVADENGKKVIKKDQIAPDPVVAPPPVDEKLQEIVARHTKERLEMYQKHERDYLDLSPSAPPASTDQPQ